MAPDHPNPTGQWKRTGPKPNVEKAKQQDMRDFFGSGSSSAATQSSAASLPKAGMSADPIDAPEEPVHTPVPESAEKHGGPAAPTPYEELPHSAGLTLSFLLSILSPVLFGNADSGTRRMASRQVNPNCQCRSQGCLAHGLRRCSATCKVQQPASQGRFRHAQPVAGASALVGQQARALRTCGRSQGSMHCRSGRPRG